MGTTRDELREELVAVIEAAPELPKGDRHHLADVFLDRLNAEYDVVPRGTGRKPPTAETPRRSWWRAHWVPIALVLAFLIFVLPAVAHHHFPIFLLIVVGVFFAVKRAMSGRSWTPTSW